MHIHEPLLYSLGRPAPEPVGLGPDHASGTGCGRKLEAGGPYPDMPLTRRAALKGVLATTIGSVTGVTAYGLAYERHRIGLTHASLPFAGLPPALDGLRIGFLTDIHYSSMVPAEDILEAVRLVHSASPDLIVLGGDYITLADRAYVGPVAELLKPLWAPHGVFAIMGNHDDDRDMPAALVGNGFTVLRDQRTLLAVRGETLDLIGLRFWTRDPANVHHVLRQSRGPRILLAHDPRRMSDAVALGVPCVLSGHTHGGQIVIPGLGAVAARKFPIAAGTLVEDRTSLFVSRGIGTVYVPLRINCPPEVAIVTLRRQPDIA